MWKILVSIHQVYLGIPSIPLVSLYLCLAKTLLLVSVCWYLGKEMAGVNGPSEGEVKELRRTVEEELDRCVNFWLAHSHDKEHGYGVHCLVTLSLL